MLEIASLDKPKQPRPPDCTGGDQHLCGQVRLVHLSPKLSQEGPFPNPEPKILGEGSSPSEACRKMAAEHLRAQHGAGSPTHSLPVHTLLVLL